MHMSRDKHTMCVSLCPLLPHRQTVSRAPHEYRKPVAHDEGTLARLTSMTDWGVAASPKRSCFLFKLELAPNEAMSSKKHEQPRKLLWVELCTCPPNSCAGVLTPGPQNVTLLGSRVMAAVISYSGVILV